MNVNKFRGKSNREARKKKHDARCKKEFNEMKSNGKKINFFYWGWSEQDPSPFLGIKINFRDPIIPGVFMNDLETVLTELLNEHL